MLLNENLEKISYNGFTKTWRIVSFHGMQISIFKFLAYQNIGSESYLRAKTDIQHTHPQYLSTCTETSTHHKSTHCNMMG